MFRLLLHAIGRLFITLVFGVPPVDKIQDKQCIVVSNHNSHMDIMILFRVFSLGRINNVKVVAAKDFFSGGLSGLFGHLLFKLILLERDSRDAVTALSPIETALAGGFSVILFPEGTRGKPGVMQRFKSGIGKLAIDFPNVPVYPVFLHGVEKTLPRGGCLPVPFNVRLKVMPPVFGRDFALICFVNSLAFFSIYLIVPVLPLFLEERGYSNALIGFLMAIATIAALLRPLFGRLADLRGKGIMLDFFNKNTVRGFLASYFKGNQAGTTGIRNNFLEFQSVTLDRP